MVCRTYQFMTDKGTIKKIIVSLALCLALIMPLTVSAASDITVLINGVKLETEVAPKIVEGRTMLPMRAIFEELGATVTWMQEDKIIFATKGECLIVMQIDNNMMSVRKSGDENNKSVTLDVAPFIESDRTLVPVRAVAEALQAKVNWDNDTRTVIIETIQ